MKRNVVIYDAEDQPIFVLNGDEEVITHDVPALLPPGGYWREVTDVRRLEDAPPCGPRLRPLPGPARGALS